MDSRIPVFTTEEQQAAHVQKRLEEAIPRNPPPAYAYLPPSNTKVASSHVLPSGARQTRSNIKAEAGKNAHIPADQQGSVAFSLAHLAPSQQLRSTKPKSSESSRRPGKLSALCRYERSIADSYPECLEYGTNSSVLSDSTLFSPSLSYPSNYPLNPRAPYPRIDRSSNTAPSVLYAPSAQYPHNYVKNMINEWDLSLSSDKSSAQGQYARASDCIPEYFPDQVSNQSSHVRRNEIPGSSRVYPRSVQNHWPSDTPY